MIIIEGGRTALLSTVKWSLRHDRQKQLSDELDCYVQLLSQDAFPEYEAWKAGRPGSSG